MPWWSVLGHVFNGAEVREIAPKVQAVMLTEQIGAEEALNRVLAERAIAKVELDAAKAVFPHPRR